EAAPLIRTAAATAAPTPESAAASLTNRRGTRRAAVPCTEPRDASAPAASASRGCVVVVRPCRAMPSLIMARTPASRASSGSGASALIPWSNRRSSMCLLLDAARIRPAQRGTGLPPGPVQPGPDGPHRDAERLGDLLVAEVGPGDHEQHVPLVR